MPPNTQQSVQMDQPISFTNSFWSKDKSGMNNLLGYIKSMHDELDHIYDIYFQRSQIEQEFSQKLAALSEKHEKKENPSAYYQAIVTELKQTSESHLEFSRTVNTCLADDVGQKLKEYKELLEKWISILEEIYNEKHLKITELLKTRTKYLKECELSKGRSTSATDSLKSQYKLLVADIDKIAHEWNTTWNEACDVMEAMEEDRIDFVKENVGEYANLASTCLTQTMWYESIQKELEVCNAKEEIENCVSLYGTGSKIPTINEYVDEIRRQQERKSTSSNDRSSRPPKLPSKPSKYKNAVQDTDQVHSKSIQRNSFHDEGSSRNPENLLQKNDAKQLPRTRSVRDEFYQRTKHMQKKEDKSDSVLQSVNENTNMFDKNNETDEDRGSTSDTFKNSKHFEQLNNLKNRVSNNVGSTAARAPIKRKPLDKALMDQVTNEMEMARKQRELENKNSQTTDRKDERKNSALEALQETAENSQSLSSDDDNNVATSSNTLMTNSKKPYRQPSEYKPDTGSIPVRRGNFSHVLKEINPPNTCFDQKELSQEQLTHPVVAPKSPRPPPQQIITDMRQQNNPLNNPKKEIEKSQQAPIASNAHLNQNGQYHQPYVGAPQNMNPGYLHQQQQQQMPQHSPMLAPQRSPAMQPQVSPMMPPPVSPIMHPQRSPMMQPQRSPMMQPQVSPMMHPQRSPMMQPLHSPMLQPMYQPYHHHQNHQQRALSPSPINIPPTNYAVSPQPSPAMSCATLVNMPPNFALPSPVVQHAQQYSQRPSVYLDGSPILFWVRAKHPYVAKDDDEITFRHDALIGITEGNMHQIAWWQGAVFDERSWTWEFKGSVPGNLTELIQ